MKFFFRLQILIIGLLVVSSNVHALATSVSLDNSELPANDLLHPQYGHIDPDLALELRNVENLDLSKLNPIPNDLWNDVDKFFDNVHDENLPVFDGQTLNFSGKISSFSGLFRFNAVNSSNERFQIHIAQNIHTMLLRKNLLRKLGFIVPRSKYLKKIKIQFENEKQKNDFKDVDLVLDLGLAPSRWISEEGTDYLILQDIVAKMPSEVDGLDIALTMIPEELSSRALRGSLLVYNLLNMGESVNKFSFNSFAKKDSQLILDHGTEAIFNASLDDLRWMGSRLAKLTRLDFEEIVADAKFPYVVSRLLIERIIARRNNLLEAIDVKVKKLDFEKNLNLEGVEDGFLTTENFSGYASRFSHGIQKGPLDDLWRYLIVEIQSTVISSGVDIIGEKLHAFSLGEARYNWLVKDFQNNRDYAVDYFTEHGEFPPLPISSWTSPVLNGNIILGRDIVIGGSLGTDHFVQLADTVGFTFTLGYFVGLERVISQTISGSVLPNIGVVVNYTHVKPIQSLKQALKEPYKNMLVNFLLKKVKKNLKKIDATDGKDEITRQEEISKIYEEISKNLGVDESIIISENITPDISLTLKGPLLDGGNLSGTVGTRYKCINRIQIYRKSKHEFQVYFDDGNLKELYMRANLQYLIPILGFESKKSVGSMDMNYINFNLNPNLNENPNFYKNVAALYSVLSQRDSEIVANAPVKVNSKIDDRSSKFSILFFVSKTAKRLTNMYVKFKGALDSKFVSSTYGKQHGFNISNFLKTVANYYLNLYSDFFSFDLNPYKNAGRTPYGTSHTNEVSFEAKLKDVKKQGDLENFSTMYAVYNMKTEGGSISEKRLTKKLARLNKDIGKDIYNDGHAKEAGDLQLYKLETKLHFYDEAIEKMINLTDEDVKTLEKLYESKIPSSCDFDDNQSTISRDLVCGDFDYIRSFKKRCVNKFYDDEIKDGQKCMARLVYYFAEYLPYDVLEKFFGEDNIYLESSLNGFRKKSEFVYKPIYGQAHGRINSKYKSGPFDAIKNFLGVLGGELDGSWFREKL